MAGKTTTKNIVKKFKTRLTDPQKKAQFTYILKKLAKVVEEYGEKYLVLKDEYKAPTGIKS